MILAVAIVIKDEAGAPFQAMVLPQIQPIAAFQAKTAFGKLNAEITPTVPKGFQTSIIKCYGLSELKMLPLHIMINTQLFLKVHKPYHKHQLFIELNPNLQKEFFPFTVKSTCLKAIF